MVANVGSGRFRSEWWWLWMCEIGERVAQHLDGRVAFSQRRCSPVPRQGVECVCSWRVLPVWALWPRDTQVSFARSTWMPCLWQNVSHSRAVSFQGQEGHDCDKVFCMPSASTETDSTNGNVAANQAAAGAFGFHHHPVGPCCSSSCKGSIVL